jgi:hypothetical protein
MGYSEASIDEEESRWGHVSYGGGWMVRTALLREQPKYMERVSQDVSKSK